MSKEAIRLACLERNINLPRGRWDWMPFFGYRAIRRRALRAISIEQAVRLSQRASWESYNRIMGAP
jgi:hypothetical protein